LYLSVSFNLHQVYFPLTHDLRLGLVFCCDDRSTQLYVSCFVADALLWPNLLHTSTSLLRMIDLSHRASSQLNSGYLIMNSHIRHLGLISPSALLDSLIACMLRYVVDSCSNRLTRHMCTNDT
jgi:hypothetical protein